MSAEDEENEEPQPGNAIPMRTRARGVGRPIIVEDIKLIAQEYSVDVMRAMAEIALDDKEKAQSRVAAGQIVLGYAYGKPMQTMEHSGPDGAAIRMQQLDMSRLTPDELRTMADLARKAALPS